MLFVQKCQCLSLASYKHSVQVDTSCCSTEAGSSIALLWCMTTWSCRDLQTRRPCVLKCLSGTKASFSVVLRGVCLTPTWSCTLCVCVWERERECPDWDSCSVSQHHKCPYSGVQWTLALHWEPLSINQEMSPVLRDRNSHETHHTHTFIKSLSGSFLQVFIMSEMEKRRSSYFFRTCQVALTSFNFFLGLHY